MRGPEELDVSDDLVGVASARLLAAGVPRRERLDALRLLGILAGVADADHRVRRPLADIAAEFSLPPADAERWLDRLISVDIAYPSRYGIELAGSEPPAAGGLRLNDFLDVVAELDERRTRKTVVTAMARPAAALVAAAALVVVALLSPSIVRQRTTPTASTGGSDTTAVTTTDDDVVPGTTARSRRGQSGSPSTSSSPSVTSAQPTDTTTAPGPVTTTTLLPCPVGVPLLEVIGSSPTGDQLAVQGTAQNLSDVAVTIESFVVTTVVGGREVSVPGTVPIHVPARSQVAWQSLLPVAAPGGTPVDATLGSWAWDASAVPAGCPSS